MSWMSYKLKKVPHFNTFCQTNIEITNYANSHNQFTWSARSKQWDFPYFYCYALVYLCIVPPFSASLASLIKTVEELLQ